MGEPTGHGDIEHLMRVMAKCGSSLEGVCPVESGGQLDILFNANDLFYWACSDVERYEEGDEELLESCYADLHAADAHYGPLYVVELFCCRKRKMRPQYPFFRKYDAERKGYFEDALSPAVRALFDALGPEGSDRNRG